MCARSSIVTSRWPLWAFLIVVACLVYREFSGDRDEDKMDRSLRSWLEANGLSFLVDLLNGDGITSLEEFLLLNTDSFTVRHKLRSKEKKILTSCLDDLRRKNLEMTQWLENKGLGKYMMGFYKLGYTDIEHVREKMLRFEIKDVVALVDGSFADYQALVQAVEELKDDANNWLIVSIVHVCFRVFVFLLKWFVRLLLIALGYAFIKYSTLPYYHALMAARPRNLSALQYLLGNFLDPMSCEVKWLWEDNSLVGNTVSLNLKLCCKNWLLPYAITGKENVLIEIQNNKGTVEFVKERYVEKRNVFCITFNPKVSGRYTISVMIDGKHVYGSPFKRTFMPGPVDISNISLLNGINTIVLTRGVYYPLKIETRDKYENLCEMEKEDGMFDVCVKQVGSDGLRIDPEPVIFPEIEGGKNMLHIKIDEEGCFHAVVTCKGRSITNGSFDIVSLNDSDCDHLEKATRKNNWHQTWYEGYLLPNDYSSHPVFSRSTFSEFVRNCRKIYFYFSSRQLVIKEFYFKIIPYRLHSFRISPSTKITFPDNDEKFMFLVNDGMQPSVSFYSSKRSLIVATFARLLLRNIGGAESFEDKRKFFYQALQAHHNIQEKKITVEVNRRNILESTYDATRSFSASKWCRRFFVKFEGEPGYDAGGLTREWISLLSNALFDPENELFTQFNKEDKQALTYPNPNRPSRLKLKYYELAGRVVGKCIFESSCSSIRRLNVKARFMRSFLAQLIGLRVNYTYFKTDDKQLYASKIKYIQEVDPEDLGLCFSEEEYDRKGKPIKEVDLIPNGRMIAVTEKNKMKYLDALSQYKLRTRVLAEVEAFTKGLNDLVPDNLLTMFSEQELELLICGTSEISVNDFKNNHRTFSDDASFLKVMSWFWKAIALFNQEEFARLLQFTTGSSQLPPGGFACLTPPFSFSSSPLKNVLPRAHTCFNQLVLPDYTSYEVFERSLHLAITEGCEGFAFD